MRIDNHDLQRDTLAAAAPLFPSASKSNYATAIVQYLSLLKKFLILNEKLRYFSLFKISNSSNILKMKIQNILVLVLMKL